MKFVLMFMLILSAACADIPANGRYTVTHTIDLNLDQISREIKQACEDAYATPVEVDVCIQDALQSIMDGIAGAGV